MHDTWCIMNYAWCKTQDAWCMTMRSESSNHKLGCLDKDCLFWNLCWDRQTSRPPQISSGYDPLQDSSWANHKKNWTTSVKIWHMYRSKCYFLNSTYHTFSMKHPVCSNTVTLITWFLDSNYITQNSCVWKAPNSRAKMKTSEVPYTLQPLRLPVWWIAFKFWVCSCETGLWEF